MVCLVSSISTVPLLVGRPRKAKTHITRALAGDMPHVETCEMAANSAKESPSLPPNKLLRSSSKRLVSQPSPAKASVACEISELLGSRNQCCTVHWACAGKVDIHCMWKSVVWLLRSIVLVQKCSQKQSHDLNSKNFWGGGMPSDPPSCCVLMNTLLT